MNSGSASQLVVRVARRFVASYFDLGTIVLYGKYKNHRGKVVAFGKDKWGNPTIEIEPIPKGRKQNKVLGLFKIWRADVKEKALAELNKEAAEVLRPSANLKEVRQKKQTLFASLSQDEIEALQTVDKYPSVLGRMGDDTLSVTIRSGGLGPRSKAVVEQRPIGKAVTKLVRAGWLRWSEGPIKGHGFFHLTTAGENALRAFAEGNPPLLVKQAMSDLSKSVVARYIKAEGIPLGKTWETGTVRIHRYRGSFRITDLTNAGKRGKKVKEMTLSVRRLNDEDPWYDNMAKILAKVDSYDDVSRLIRDVQQDYPGEINMNETELRGIDVNPGGTTKITLSHKTDGGGKIEITAEPHEFLVKSTHMFKGKDGEFAQDTIYYSRKKEGAAVFYNWLKANLSQANKMDIDDLRKLWNDLGIKYDFH